MERSEIRPIRTAIVRLPNSVEHSRTHDKVSSIDHSITGLTCLLIMKEMPVRKKSTKNCYENYSSLELI